MKLQICAIQLERTNTATFIVIYNWTMSFASLHPLVAILCIHMRVFSPEITNGRAN